MKKKTANRVTETLLETTKDMHALAFSMTRNIRKSRCGTSAKRKPRPQNRCLATRFARCVSGVPGGLCALFEPDDQLCVATGTRGQASERRGAAQCHPAQRHRDNSVEGICCSYPRNPAGGSWASTTNFTEAGLFGRDDDGMPRQIGGIGKAGADVVGFEVREIRQDFLPCSIRPPAFPICRTRECACRECMAGHGTVRAVS